MRIRYRLRSIAFFSRMATVCWNGFANPWMQGFIAVPSTILQYKWDTKREELLSKRVYGSARPGRPQAGTTGQVDMSGVIWGTLVLYLRLTRCTKSPFSTHMWGSAAKPMNGKKKWTRVKRVLCLGLPHHEGTGTSSDIIPMRHILLPVSHFRYLTKGPPLSPWK